jgi:peptidoglycan/xylan/chitin deacetylase (PgdA/CDA1 family)
LSIVSVTRYEYHKYNVRTRELVQRTVGMFVSLFIAIVIGGNVFNNAYSSSELSNGIPNQQKVVILTFDDGYESQYSNAKPILDKYGFKATFYIVCNYVGSGDDRMTWEEIKSLQQEGHDIASHTMNHDDLSKLTPQEAEYEVAQSKQCLLEQGINPKSFAYPFNGGSDEPSIISSVASHYDLARTATDPLAFLNCSDNCDTSKYSIVGWSHDSEKKNNAYNDQQMLERFVEVVNSQIEYNTNGVNAVPILIWHKIDNSNEEYSTSTNLFDAELKYLHDNGFTVLTMADLVYDDTSKYLRISNDDSAHSSIPNSKSDDAARIADIEEMDDENINTPSNEESGSDRVREESAKEDLAYAGESVEDKDHEEEEGESDGEIPSAILQFLDAP